MVAIAALTSLGTTSPLYSMQHAMYLPCLGSHFTIWLAGSKHALVIRGKWILGYGTRFVWNSVRSTLSAPSNLSEAVMDDTICPIIRLRLV